MSEISSYPAVQQINFYINDASPELLFERRVYLEKLPTPMLERKAGRNAVMERIHRR
ncbi:hypothetical protein [Salmonella enterica]|uniref:hypothetical protein n=1 Tax=Salmonella enterica TaxID=28901 RepID=UPI0020797A93|nr:hypothetical protein [Salmonella enterica]USL74541.1 hypothetical protein NFH10_17705 [Salmonella enterica subsp. enterica serovar Indiana]